MKRFGVEVRVLVIAAACMLLTLALVGCGSSDKNKGGNSSSGSGTASNGGKTYAKNQPLGAAKKVVVNSNQGFDAEQQAVIAKITEFGDATAAKNYKKLCDDIMAPAVQNISGGCVHTFSATGGQIKDFKLTISSVTVGSDGKSATAKILTTSNVNTTKTPQDLALVKDSKGNWRITILGQ